MGKVRGTNHHGRSKASKPSSPKHIDRNKLKEAKHIDPDKSKENRYWTWDRQWKEPGDCEAAERAYYHATFAAGQDAQNERHQKKGNYKRIRTVDELYDNPTNRPEGSLLYIGSLKTGMVDPDTLWECAMEYRDWEIAESEAKGGFYKPLTMALHADEKGQLHVEEHGVYQYRDKNGYLMPGQNAALEAAGFELPDKSKARGRYNNRKMAWDAVRREKWLDIMEAHGFDVIREPEENRPHLGLEAWQAYEDEKVKLEAEADQRQAALDAQAAAQDAKETELDAKAEAFEKNREEAKYWEEQVSGGFFSKRKKAKKRVDAELKAKQQEAAEIEAQKIAMEEKASKAAQEAAEAENAAKEAQDTRKREEAATAALKREKADLQKDCDELAKGVQLYVDGQFTTNASFSEIGKRLLEARPDLCKAIAKDIEQKKKEATMEKAKATLEKMQQSKQQGHDFSL